VRRLLTALALTALLGTAACAPSADHDDPFIVQQVGAPDLDVDTPELRSLKEEAGVAACEPGAASNDLPAVTLPCLGGGKAVDLSTLQGPLLVNVWGYWCDPCRDEMPYYGQFAREHGDVVSVLGIDYQDFLPDEALKLLDRSDATFPQLADPGGAIGGRKMDVNPDRTLPIIILVRADGTIAWQAYQRIDDLQQLEDLVSEHLGVTL